MRRLVIILLLIPLMAFAQEQNKVYIPKNLADCHRTLDTLLPDSTQQRILSMTEKEFKSGAHFGLGMWIRNNWGLWRGSRLQYYFEKRGLYHPDDMSGLILTTYWRYKHGQPLGVKKEIKKYKEYWKQYPHSNPNYNPTPTKGINYDHSLEENVAFLHLPIIDSVTGARAELHSHHGIDTHALAYWHNHMTINPPFPAAFPNDYELHGRVRNLRVTGYDYYTRKTMYETIVQFDTLGRTVYEHIQQIGWDSHSQTTIRSYLYGSDGWPRLAIEISDSTLVDIWYYTRTDYGYIKRDVDTYYAIKDTKRIFGNDLHALIPDYDDTSILFGISHLDDLYSEERDFIMLLAYRDDVVDSIFGNGYITKEHFLYHIYLDSAGREICVIHDSDTTLTQYDSLGRIVSWLEYNWYDDHSYIGNGATHVYDDQRNMRYTFNNHSQDVICYYLDRHGNVTGSRYKDHRLRPTPHHYRWHYDSHGNWTRLRQKHRTVARREIEYYQ